MLSIYWQLSSRLLDEEDCGKTTSSTSGTFMHSHTHHHHQFSHQNYPINYSRSGMDVDKSDIEAGGIKAIKQERPESILRTPQPKRSAKNIFSDSEDNNEIIIITKNEATKLADISASYYHQQYRIHDGNISASSSSTSSSDDYKSLQISPLDFSQMTNTNIY